MSLTVSRKDEQAKGAFDGGKIQENKPIGFPQEKGKLKGYSHLLYWAHAWSDDGGLIPEHPHEGFDILSFVLKGRLVHYDSYYDERKPLEAGGVQIIRSGSGITHEEEFEPGTHIFQIWFDPDITKSMQKQASYSNHPPTDFPEKEVNGIKTVNFVGPNAPIETNAENIEVWKAEFPKGRHSISLNPDQITSIYVVSGKLKTGGIEFQQDDFLKVEDEEDITFHAPEDTELFVIQDVNDPGFTTFLQRNGIT